MFLNLHNFSICFHRLLLHIQVLMYRNRNLLDESITIVGVLVVAALMLFVYVFFYVQKYQLFLDKKKK